MKILVSAYFVSGDSREGGSGRLMKCIADSLSGLGHEVMLTNNEEDYGCETFDLIICSHFIPKANGYKIFLSHGIIADEKMALGADEYVSISEEVRQKNLANGIDSRVIPQPIDLPEKFRVPEKLEKILIIRREEVNYDPFEFLQEKYDVRISNLDRPIEWQIDEADLVIALGRGALEAMAYGKPVLVADNRPYIGAFGDGYLTWENVGEIAKCNFSGRLFRFPVSRNWIEGELERYNPSDGIILRQYVEKHHDAKKIAEQFLAPRYKFVFGVMVNDLMRVKQVIVKSELSPDIICHTIEDPDSATEALNKLLDLAEKDGADICVLAHQDMYFPRNWIHQATQQIRQLPDDWMLAGIIGKDNEGHYCGHLHDARTPLKYHTIDMHKFPNPAVCMDECCIIVNMKSGFRFDEWMKGFDLYGTLGPLQARDAGGSVWIIDAFATHYCTRQWDWVPDQLFSDNFKAIYNRYKHLTIDSTVFGIEIDERGNVISTISYRREAENWDEQESKVV